MATFDDGTQIDDSSNYTHPATVAGPTKFTGSATAASSDLAESLARESARSKALTAYGSSTTQFVGVDNIRVKIVGDKEPFTYEATFETQAIQTEAEWYDTEDAPVEIEDVPPEEDPFEEARLAREQDYEELQEPPDIDPEEDPFEEARLARERDYEELQEPPAEEDADSEVKVIPRPESKPQQTAAATPPDWRFRISLASKADYFYMSDNPGILAPLKHTNGVVFPYTPSVSVAYSAQYETTQVTHSNYKVYNYNSSSVDSISVTGDFTAQDAAEANYMLAVIHFFRSATKMFYGKSSHRGVPPPLLYLSGFGQYQFDNHPVVLQSFTYSLPTDVDYINAYPNGVKGSGVNGAQINNFDLNGGNKNSPIRNFIEGSINRLISNGLAGAAGTKKDSKPGSVSSEVTRVPTKIQISLSFIPMISRYTMSNEFSLDDYASGKLLRGSQNPKLGGGVW
jgi:hypothetical protein